MTTPTNTEVNYTKEVRFAVVMYGGVSLAIYINGVAQELLRMVKATAPRDDREKFAREFKPKDGEPSTQEVYRKLSYLVDDSQSRAKLKEDLARDPKALANWNPKGAIRVRFMVDVLAGTSAGGINSIYLAKALANDQDMNALKNLWISEGDIEVLINDRKSLDNTTLDREKVPHSLLNSRRMYLRLLEALDGMDVQSDKTRRAQVSREASDGPAPNGEANGNQPAPLVDELDLYITATDIRGLSLPIRLADAVVQERRHKNVFHFKYMTAAATGADVNEFRSELNPFLAFAARTTSSFPFAFEPVRLNDIRELLDHSEVHRAQKDSFTPGGELIKRFFKDNLTQETKEDCDLRSFADGGYLDNKPFSYATSALMRRTPNVPVDRKLIYIEPSPEQERDAKPKEPPDAIENVLAAVNLPRYETIREDIQTVLDRNRLIERVNSLVSEIERDIENCARAGLSTPAQAALKTLSEDEQTRFQNLLRPDVQPTIPWQVWNDLTLPDMAALLGIHYLPYRRLRISSLTDELAKLTTSVAGLDERSDLFMAVRALVRTWRKDTFSDEKPDPVIGRTPEPGVSAARLGATVSPDPLAANDQPKRTEWKTLNYFLNKFDLDYRMRRLNFLVAKIDELLRLLESYSKQRELFEAATREVEPGPYFADLESKFAEAVREPKSAGPLIRKLEERGPENILFDFTRMTVAQTDDGIQSLLYLKRELNQQFISLRKFGRELRNPPADQVEADAKQAGFTPDTDAEQSAEELRKKAKLDHEAKIRQYRESVKKIELKKEHLQLILGETINHQKLQVQDEFAVAYLRSDDVTGRAETFWAESRKFGLPNLKADFSAAADHLQELVTSVLAPTGARVRRLLNLEKKSESGTNAPSGPLNSSEASAGDQLDRQYLESPFALTVRAYLGWYFDHFDDYDQITFPIYFETNAGESDIIEVIRISPEDAPSLIDEKTDSRRRKKLAGTRLANFSAFLDASWRVNDIMWGRLDGAERLIKSMLPDDKDQDVREALTREAHQIILNEELDPYVQNELKGLLAQALVLRKAKAKLPISDAIAEILKPIDDEVLKKRLTNVMTTCLEGDKLYAFIKDGYEANRHFEPKPTLRVLGRATRVMSSMLDDISRKHNAESKLTTWMSRISKIFMGLVEVSVPNSLPRQLFRHALTLLYVLEALLILGGILFSQTGVKSVGWSLLAVTFGINVAVLVLSDFMRGKNRWPKIALSLFVIVVGFFAAIGVDEFVNIGMRKRISHAVHRVTWGTLGTPEAAPTPIPVLVTFPPSASPSPSPTPNPVGS